MCCMPIASQLSQARARFDDFLSSASYRDFSRPLLGKTVAVVGPAGYLPRTRGIAQQIASCEVVARPNVRVGDNHRLVLPPNTTHRADFVYHSGSMIGELVGRGQAKDAATQFSALNLRTLRVYEAHGVQATIVVACGNEPRVRSLANLSIAHSAAFTPRMRLLLAPGAGSVDECMRPEERFRTGIKALLDVYRQRPSRILLVGFDFCASPR